MKWERLVLFFLEDLPIVLLIIAMPLVLLMVALMLQNSR